MTTTRKKRKPPASDAMKALYVACKAAGMTRASLSILLDRSVSCLQGWDNPAFMERRRVGCAKWRDEHAEEEKVRKAEYYKQNRQSVLDRVSRYYQNNTELCRARSTEVRKRRFEQYPDEVRASRNERNHLRRVKATGIPEWVFIDNAWFEVDLEETYRIWGSHLVTKEERRAIKELALEAVHLSKKTGIQYHLDHIRPISKGGEHSILNLQIIPASENTSKHNKFRPEDQELLAKRFFMSKK